MIIPTLTSPEWDDIPAAHATAAPQIHNATYLQIPTQYGSLYFSLSPQGLRIQSSFLTEQFAIIKTDISASIDEYAFTDSLCTLVAGSYRLELHLQPLVFKLFFENKLVQQSATDGHFVRQYRIPPFAKVDNGWLINLELDHEESVYGLGEKWSRLDKRGQLVHSFNHDALGVNADKSYKNTPYAWSLKGWHSFVHTPAPVTHSVGYAPWSQRAYGILVEDEHLDMFLYHAQSPANGLYQYCTLTGFAPVPPDWSLGVILSKAYYKDADELLNVARKVRAENMPCDVITLDGRAWQDTDTRFAFEWDPKRYSNPKPIIDELKALHFKICVWEYPMVSVNNPLYQKASERGWLLKDKRTGETYRYVWDTKPFGEVLTPLPDSGIWDFTHPDAYAYWREAHKDLFALGIDMIKADFGEQLEDENIISYSGDDGIRLHNVYSLLYNRCVYEGAKKYSQTGPFLFSRSAWSGSQCYPSQWGGDPQADWHGLSASIRGSLAWGMSGGPFFATDIGGFYKDTRDPLLYVRWTQASLFSAHIRLHGIGEREPWSYGKEAEQAVNKALAMRYSILPYLKEAVRESHETGLPVQRAMPLAFPHDRLTHQFEHQFMCGSKMLVVPCIQPSGSVEYYLPDGDWVTFPDQQIYRGGKVYQQTLALDEVLVFVRLGDEITIGDEITHTDMIQSTSTWTAQ